MDALIMWARGGLIPHAWHGESGVCWFAVDGSKLEGTELEKPQIGHTQVALTSRAGAGLDRGDDVADRTRASLGDAFLGTGLLIAGAVRLDGFGNSVILGDDFT